jgi:hypothetical protein
MATSTRISDDEQSWRASMMGREIAIKGNRKARFRIHQSDRRGRKLPRPSDHQRTIRLPQDN